MGGVLAHDGSTLKSNSPFFPLRNANSSPHSFFASMTHSKGIMKDPQGPISCLGQNWEPGAGWETHNAYGRGKGRKGEGSLPRVYGAEDFEIIILLRLLYYIKYIKYNYYRIILYTL